MAQQKIVISIPGYVAIPALPTRDEPVVEDEDESVDVDEFLKRGKKRRLDHLSWEEKIQRKKLKNRVAAQTSRDRKKQKMDEMESIIGDLQKENTTLKGNYLSLEKENRALREKNDSLEQQMKELRERMDRQDEAIFNTAKTTTTTTVSGSSTNKTIDLGSAASINVDPQQQGLLEDPKTAEQAMRLWRVITLCLVYKICSPATSLISANWKNLPSPCSPTLVSKWQTIAQKMEAEMPRMRAPYHQCLDKWWGPAQQSWNPKAVGGIRAEA